MFSNRPLKLSLKATSSLSQLMVELQRIKADDFICPTDDKASNDEGENLGLKKCPYLKTARIIIHRYASF